MTHNKIKGRITCYWWSEVPEVKGIEVKGISLWTKGLVCPWSQASNRGENKFSIWLFFWSLHFDSFRLQPGASIMISMILFQSQLKAPLLVVNQNFSPMTMTLTQKSKPLHQRASPHSFEPREEKSNSLIRTYRLTRLFKLLSVKSSATWSSCIGTMNYSTRISSQYKHCWPLLRNMVSMQSKSIFEQMTCMLGILVPWWVHLAYIWVNP